MAPPSGPPPVPVEDMDPAYVAESNLAIVFGIPTALHFIAVLFIAARLYVRFRMVRSVGWDDWTMMACLGVTFGTWVTLLVQSLNGLGRHFDTLSGAEKAEYGLAGFVHTLIGASLGFTFLKLSIALSLLRLSSSKWYRFSIYGVMGLIVAFVPFSWSIFFLHCKPMQFHWDKRIQGGTCFGIDLFIDLSLVNTAFNIATDVFFATMPIPIVWSLQMKQKIKIYLIAILSLGYFAVGLGAVKATYQINFGLETDKTFTNAIQFWGFLQLNVGIIAACAPSLKPLVSRFLGLSTTYGSGPSRNTNQRAYGYGKSDRRSHAVMSGKHMQLDDDFELEIPHDGVKRAAQTQVRGTPGNGGSTFYDGGDRSGSEELILAQGKPGGIMRTTEIIVK